LAVALLLVEDEVLRRPGQFDRVAVDFDDGVEAGLLGVGDDVEAVVALGQKGLEPVQGWVVAVELEVVDEPAEELGSITV